MLPNTFLSKVMRNLGCGKNSQKLWDTSAIFKNAQTQTKQSPIGRKFAQSGHPAFEFPVSNPIVDSNALSERMVERARSLFFIVQSNTDIERCHCKNSSKKPQFRHSFPFRGIFHKA
jgi:hypothetical protein